MSLIFALGFPGAAALVLGALLIVPCLIGGLIFAGAGDARPAPAVPARES
jgi:hypothetical protein